MELKWDVTLCGGARFYYIISHHHTENVSCFRRDTESLQMFGVCPFPVLFWSDDQIRKQFSSFCSLSTLLSRGTVVWTTNKFFLKTFLQIPKYDIIVRWSSVALTCQRVMYVFWLFFPGILLPQYFLSAFLENFAFFSLGCSFLFSQCCCWISICAFSLLPFFDF